MKHILAVEDDPDIQKVLKLALETVGGFHITLASSGQDALAALDRCRPDLILLDVMMPGMDGPTTLGRIRERAEHQATPTIFLTAKAQMHEIQHLLALGAIAVIAKPFDPMRLAEAVRAHWAQAMNTAGQEVPAPEPELSLEASIEALRQEFIAEIPQRLADIDTLWQAVKAGKARLADLQELLRLVHSLSGTSRTYGLDALGLHAKKIEKALQAHSEAGQLPPSQALPRFDADFSTLKSLAGQPAASAKPADTEAPPLPLESKALVYLLEDDPAQAAFLAAQLRHFGYRVKSFQEVAPLLDGIDEGTPSAMVLDIMLREGPMAGVELARQLSSGPHKDIPIIFASSRDDITARLEAVRAGCQAYLRKPIDIGKLVDSLDRSLRKTQFQPYRVLIVDDQALVARHTEAILREAGMDAVVVTSPFDVLTAIGDYTPDLILMDVYMPDCTGDELARLIRQHGSYDSLPIVFLSSEEDPDAQLSAMRTGADDFLTKPVEPGRLVQSVQIRAERSRLLNSLMVRDSMTGLLNHARSKEALAVEIARAQRNNTPLSVAMIDIDRFKSINDQYGHPIGDRVIKGLARLIRERLRATDSGGRYGGEEFIVLLPNCPPKQAATILNDLRIRFGQVRHASGDSDSEFTATFSSGISSYPICGSVESLIATADAALYEAKKRGRNRVIMATGDIRPA
ncbi:MAG: response regulator [Betaproteobacteria bacterium]|nr:response regulator [Betaproteobacteria bacterium]